MNLQKEEHKSNIKELNQKIQELELNLQLKTDQAKKFQQEVDSKDKEIQRYKLDIEKLNRTMKDLSLNFKLTQRTNEETIARKTKEVETILKEKKCKNCIICLEDLKDKPTDSIVKDLNERLIVKTNKIA